MLKKNIKLKYLSFGSYLSTFLKMFLHVMGSKEDFKFFEPLPPKKKKSTRTLPCFTPLVMLVLKNVAENWVGIIRNIKRFQLTSWVERIFHYIVPPKYCIIIRQNTNDKIDSSIYKFNHKKCPIITTILSILYLDNFFKSILNLYMLIRHTATVLQYAWT